MWLLKNKSVFFFYPRTRIRRAFLVCTTLAFFSLNSLAFAQSYTWKNVVIMGGGFVPGLVYSPVSQGLLYARTDVGGFYRWNNSTSQWVPLTDMYRGNNFGGESIAPDPVNPNVVYAAAGFSGPGTILSSTNQGNSWTANAIPVSIAGNNDGRNAGERLAVDPNLNSKLYFGSRWQGLWVSTNSAANWSQVASFPVNGDSGYGLSWVLFPPPTGGYGNPSGSASTTIYVGVMALSSGNSNVYRSTNGGNNWTVISGGPSNMAALHASLGTDGNLWIVYAGGGYGPSGISTGQIWKLNTGTMAWTNVTPSSGPCNGCGGYGGISVDARNAQHAVITTLDWWGGPDRLFSTSNGGGSWSIIALFNSSYSVSNHNGAVYTLGCNNSVAGGVGWAACVAIDPFNSNNAIYPSSGSVPGGGVWSSTNIQSNPVSWTFTDVGLEETVPIYMNPSAVGGVLFSCMGDVGGMRHTNLAQSPTSGQYCNPQFSNTNMLDFAESRPNTVVRVGNSSNPSSVNNDVAYSTNNGQSWSPWGSAPPGYTSTGQMGSVAVAADGSRVVVSPYSGYGSPAHASSLGGSWTTCSGLPSGAMVASDRSNPSTFYATHPSQWVYGGSVTVYRSTNYGAGFTQVNTIPVQWSDPNGNGQWVIPRPVFSVPGEFWVSTYNALYRFTNAGSSVTTFSNVYEPMGPVGFGMAAPGQTHPTVFLVGTVNGTYGFFRCDDGTGASWVRINDDNHQFNNPGWIEGDEAIYGRVYLGAGGRGILYGDISIVATNTPTRTSTIGLTSTPTRTATGTPTRTPTVQNTSTRTPTPTATPSSTPSSTPSPTRSSTAAPTRTNTSTSTASASATRTATPTLTATPSPTGTGTPTRSMTPTASLTPTVTHTVTVTRTFTATGTPTATNTATHPPNTATPSSTASPSASASATRTLSPTSSPSSTPTATPTRTSTYTSTPTATPTVTNPSQPTDTPTLTATRTNTDTATSTRTPTPLPTNTPTASATPSNTLTPTATNTGTVTPVDTDTPTRTPTPAPTNTFTFTHTPTPVPTDTPSPTSTPTRSLTPTGTPSPTLSPSASASATRTSSPTSSPSSTPTPTHTGMPTGVPSGTPTATLTRSSTATWTSTPTATFTPSWTWTPNPTRTGTPTATPTATPTKTATPTPTRSWTPLPTNTSTPTPTPTFTPTNTSTASVTPTLTHTPTSTLTATATEQPGIDKPILYPNPSGGQPVSIHIPGREQAGDIEAQIFTVAFRLVQQQTFPNVPSGADVRMELMDRTGKPLASGLYYVVVLIDGHKYVGKLLLLR